MTKKERRALAKKHRPSWMNKKTGLTNEEAAEKKAFVARRRKKTRGSLKTAGSKAG